MSYLRFIKPGLFVIIIFEIVSIFVMLHIYNDFVSDPKNYTSTAMVQRQAKKTNNSVPNINESTPLE